MFISVAEQETGSSPSLGHLQAKVLRANFANKKSRETAITVIFKKNISNFEINSRRINLTHFCYELH
jgi:hypothetical protein